MKKLILLAIIVLNINAFSQQVDSPIEFPGSFRLGASCLLGFEIMPIDGDARALGIKENPGVVEDKTAMRYLGSSSTTIGGLKRIYMEMYQHREREGSDGGVMVFDFESKETMDRYLSTVYKQSNRALLTFHHHYLIKVWSDDFRNREEQLRTMVHHYQKQLGAVEYRELTETVVEEATDAAEEAAYAATKDASEDDDDLSAVDVVVDAVEYDEAAEPDQPLWAFTDSIGQTQTDDAVRLDKAFWEEHQLERLEKFQTDFTYSLYNKLEAPDYTLWMIARDYSEEQIHWGVLFDSDGKYLGFKQIAYDNSEGSFRKYTAFKGDEIRIYTENIYENEGALSAQPYMLTGVGFAN